MTGHPTRALDEPGLERLRKLLSDRTGHDFTPSRRGRLERAARDALSRWSLSDVDALCERLADADHGPEALEQLIAAITIGETYFFRNRPQMEALETTVLPELVARRADERRLRVWSAGCSSGEEPYSVAMLVDQLLPDSSWEVRILATDVNRRQLDTARRGAYGSWSFRQVPPAMVAKYFTPCGAELQVANRIRQMVTFAPLNLAEDEYPSVDTGTDRMDLILCRNVLIYFGEQAVARTVARLHDALVPGGWLVVGHAEPSTQVFQRFAVRNFPRTVLYQRPVADLQRPVADPEPVAAAPEQTLPAPSRDEGPPVRRSPRRPRRRPSSPVAGSPVPVPVADHGEAGDDGHAIDTLERAALERPEDARPPYLLARAHARRRELGAAERWIDVAIERAPLTAGAHYLRGLILQDAERTDEALEAHRRSVLADPAFVLGHSALAGLFARVGQPARAEKALNEALRLLAGVDDDESLAESDGLTAGRLREILLTQRALVA